MTESEAGPSNTSAIPLRDMSGSPSNAVSEQFVVERDRRRARRPRQPSGEIHIRPEDLDTNAPPIKILRRDVYMLMEQPNSSTSAFVIHFFSTFLIAFSACVTTLETLPAFRSSSERVSMVRDRNSPGRALHARIRCPLFCAFRNMDSIVELGDKFLSDA